VRPRSAGAASGTLFPDPDKRHHQRTGLRRLRRLRRQSNCVSVQPLEPNGSAHHRSIELQQGFFLRQGFLPVVRHRARCQAEKGQGVAADHDLPVLPDPQLPAIEQTYNIIVTGVSGTAL
jgi:indolepyruvate ferredoxin oxidoreductase